MIAERIYRLLLRAYPSAFRAQYGREMVLLFRDQCQESDGRTLGFWMSIICDVARSAPALRLEAWRENTQRMEVVMKLAAILTVLIGLLGIMNAVVEWSAGGNGSTVHVLALVLAVFASMLLLAAGAAILRSSPRGRQAARLAVLASLVLIVASRLLHPWMGIFAQFVGIGMPVALLIALYWPRRASPAGAV
jgi:O-antigen/teichoic acid export membrane protein